MYAPLLAMLFSLALPGTAFAACPSLPFTFVGQTLPNIVVDTSCDPMWEGIVPADGMGVVAYSDIGDSFSVTTTHATYMFTVTGYGAQSTIYSVQLQTGTLVADTVQVYVDTDGDLIADAARQLLVIPPAPTVIAVAPNSGPVAGGTTVTINGTNFTGASSVNFGGTNATIFTVNSATSITATVPGHSAGTVDVTVTTSGGTSTTSSADQYTYLPAPTLTGVSPSNGPTAGGMSVTLVGANLLGATVTIGGVSAGIAANTQTSIVVTTPAGTAGAKDVVATTSGGSATLVGAYTYISNPVVTAVSPTNGPVAGGTSVTITGNNFTGATAVRFGATNGTGVTVLSATSITATAPASTVGTVDITVTGPGGTSLTSAADLFTYVAAVPGAPTIGTATAGTGQASVSFTAPANNGGSTINSYTVTSSPGGFTGTGTTSPITVTGLTGGTAYTFTVTATNGVGTGAASAASNSVTPVGGQTITFTNPGTQNFGTSTTLGASSTSGLTVQFSSQTTGVCTVAGNTLTFITAGTCTITASQPGNASFAPASPVQQSFTVAAVVPSAPTIGTATAGNTQATVSFTAPASNGGEAITNYTVTSNPGGLTGTGPTSPITVAGLTNGTAYTFTVTATNGAGPGSASASSNSVTPIATQTITFSNPGSFNFGTSPQLSASASSTLPVAFTSTSTSVCTVTTSGVLTTVAPGTCTIRADQAGNTMFLPATPVTQSFAIVVPGGAVSLSTPSPLPTGTGGVAYSLTFVSAGGAAPYTYTESGALPVGMSLSPSGTLSGTPTSAGTYSFTVTVTDAATQTAQKTYQLTINAPNISLTPTVPQATVAAVYTPTILSASGGNAPYTYAITSGALPTGLTLSPAGVLSGTPTAAGTFNVTVTATDKFGFQGTQAYSIAVNAPTIVLTPSTLPTGQSAVAYSQQLSASGGLGSYTYTVSAGALPAGLSLSANGLLAGTPTVAGSFNLTVAAKDAGGFVGTQAYTLALNQPVPVVTNDTASTAANAAVTIPVTSNDTGPFTSITVAHAPGHGTATVSGLNVVYTPTNNFYGTDTFTYTATGPGGTSAQATVTVTVTPLAVPVAQPLTATVLAGKAVTLHGAQGATGGPFTALTVATPPTTGTLDISGTDIVYTPAVDASGPVSFDYTLSNAFGTSLPAHATITVNPMPVAPALTANVLAGSSVQIDLTANAHGGPFTSANVVSVTPSNAGSASIHATATGYTLTFTAAAIFSGNAQLSYTLNNAYATSAPGSIAIAVTARPDPSKDAEVLGILNAQVDSARRLAQGQISNFQQRLESLHNDSGAGGFSNGITLTSASQQNRDPMQALRGDGDGLGAGTGMARRYRMQPDGADGAGTGGPSTAGTGSLPGGITVWTGGALNFGKTQPGSSDNGIDFTTSGVSMGADKRISDAFALGAGIGYGHDASDIGQHGSRSTTDSYNVAFYGSYRPYNNVYVDSLIGYQWLSFDARRYVTGDGSIANGSRDGTQWFGSFALGYEHRTQDWLLSPYARLDLAHAQLDAYTEQGEATDALSYERQTVKTTTGNLGLRAEWTIKADYGIWLPTLRAEYEHDFQGSSVAAMRYADLLSGPLYQASLTGQSSNRALLGAGIQLQTLKGWMLRFEYQNLLESSARDNQSVLLGVEKKFNP
jgi:outer membrane autotransporter protein